MNRLFIVSARYPLFILWLLVVALGLILLSINANSTAHGVFYIAAAMVAFRFVQTNWHDVQHGTSGFAVVQPIAILLAIYLHSPYVALAASGTLLLTKFIVDAGLYWSGKISIGKPEQQKLRSLTRSALGSQSPFVKLSAKFSLPFSIMIATIAIAAAVVSGNKNRALAVLLVGSPFALLYGSLISMRAVIARAYKFGISFRSMAAIERFADATDILFGANNAVVQIFSNVADVVGKHGHTPEQVIAHAYGLLKGLKNSDVTPFVTSICSHAASHGIKPFHIKHVQISDGAYSSLYHGNHVTLATAVDKAAKYAWYNVSVGEHIIGSIRFTQSISPSTITTMQRLRGAGVTTAQLLKAGALSATTTSELKKAGISKTVIATSPASALAVVNKYPSSIYVAGSDHEQVVAQESHVSILLGALDHRTASEAADVLTASADVSKVASAVLLSTYGFKVARSTTAIGTLLAAVLVVLAAIGIITPLESTFIMLVIPISSTALALRAKRRPNILDEN